MSTPEKQDPSDYIPPGETLPEFRGREPAPYEFAERDGERTLKPVGGPDDSGESIEAQTILSQGATPSQKPLESPPATAEKAAEVKEDDKA